MKDEDLDRCPRCKEDMWAGQKLCRECQFEEDVEDMVEESRQTPRSEYVQVDLDSLR